METYKVVKIPVQSSVVNNRCMIPWICSCVIGLIFVLTYQSYQTNSPLFRPKFLSSQNWTDEDALDWRFRSGDSHNSEAPGKVVVFKRPYGKDSHCQNFVKRLFEADTFNQTALVSYPGSGNTWSRHLIELASGIYTGSLYLDVDLLARGFLGEKEQWDLGSTIVQKMHMEYKSKYRVPKAILIIRDPYKAIVSFVQYLESGHTGQASPHTFRKREWSPYVLGQTYKWITLAKSWIEAPVQTLVVHYEELRRDVVPELERICNFLQITCSNLHTSCFKNHMEGSFQRRLKLNFEPTFPSWVRGKVDNGIDFLSNILVQHGHRVLPTKLYPYYRNRSRTILAPAAPNLTRMIK